MANSMEVPQKIKNITNIWPSNPTSGCIPKGNEISILRYLHSHVHCSIIHNIQDREITQWPSINEWIRKIWVRFINTHTMQCYSALTKKEILSFSTTWMNLNDIMLSEIWKNRTHRNRGQTGGHQGLNGWETWENVGQGIQSFSYARWVSSGDLMYSMVTTVLILYCIFEIC